jgi:hypothetical protein
MFIVSKDKVAFHENWMHYEGLLYSLCMSNFGNCMDNYQIKGPLIQNLV